MTNPGGQQNTSWAGNQYLPPANTPSGTGMGAFANRTQGQWGSAIQGANSGGSAPKSQAIGEGLLTNWIGAAGNPNDPLLQENTGKGDNLVTNGDFAGSLGWTFPTGGSRDATVGRTAAGSAKIVTNGTLQALISAPVMVTPKQLVLLGAYAKWTGIVGATEASFVLQCYSDVTLLFEQELAAFTPDGDGGWQELQETFIVPAACDNVRLICEVQAASGTLWWDDVSVRAKISDTMSSIQGQVVDLQDKTQQLEDVIGYGCAYMNNNTQWSIFQSSKPVHFDTQVGPIVGASMDGTGFVLQSKGLWRADCQMTFDVYAVGNYAIDMDIVVLAPNGSVFARKNYHDSTSQYVTRTNIFSFVVPTSGYKVQVWSASGAGRGQLGGPVRTGFNVTKVSGETS